MEFTAKVIADFLHGKIEGNPDEIVNTVAKIEEAKKGSLAFLSNPKYTNYIYDTEASIVLINNGLELTRDVSATLIRVPDAYQAFASLLQLYEQSKPQKKGIDSNTSIAESASLGEEIYLGAFSYIGENVKIGNNVKIYPQCYVGDNVVINDNTILYAGVKVYHDCAIGSSCIIHAGTVIGSDGFGFAPQEGADFKKIPQVGNVILEDNVEIGANTTLDRATMGSTVIRKGVKLDNLVQIAHNVEIGENTVIASQSGISGSTKIGKNCMIGGQVGFSGHITIADNTKIGAQSGIANSVKQPGTVLFGTPAIELRNAQRAMIVYKNLPEMHRTLKTLEKQIEKLQKESDI